MRYKSSNGLADQKKLSLELGIPILRTFDTSKNGKGNIDGQGKKSPDLYRKQAATTWGLGHRALDLAQVAHYLNSGNFIFEEVYLQELET